MNSYQGLSEADLSQVDRVHERQASVCCGSPTRLVEGHRVESDTEGSGRAPRKGLGFRDAGNEELKIGGWEMSEKDLAAAWPGQTRTGRVRAGAPAGEQRGRADRQGGGHPGRGKVGSKIHPNCFSLSSALRVPAPQSLNLKEPRFKPSSPLAAANG